MSPEGLVAVEAYYYNYYFDNASIYYVPEGPKEPVCTKALNCKVRWLWPISRWEISPE